MAAPASAAPAAAIVCAGSETTDYDPPLTMESRPTAIDATATYGLCLGGPLSATGRVTGLSPSASCVAISAPRVVERVAFASGQVDVIEYPTAVKTVQLTPIPEPTACVGDGLDRAVGLTQVQILG